MVGCVHGLEHLCRRLLAAQVLIRVPLEAHLAKAHLHLRNNRGMLGGEMRCGERERGQAGTEVAERGVTAGRGLE